MTVTDAEPDVQDVDQEPDAASEQSAEPEQTPEADPVEPDEIVQPSDIVQPSGVVELRTPTGHLTIRPDQATLDPGQWAALKAIGIDTEEDPGVLPHLRAFIHMCQIRKLDPYAKEAYLIGRGQGKYRTYTMQVAIDGYRKMANATGRFLRVKSVLWTGQDDDEKSYRAVEDEDGDLVMKRIWYDQWPATRGNPGAAKVTVEHLDTSGNIVTTSAIADWLMYAPYTPKKKWINGKPVKELDAQGKEILELNDMWTNGGPHMLAKCGQALALRMAFPAAMSGFYVAEEMHRLNLQEDDRKAEVARQETRERISNARADAEVRALSAQASNDPARAGEPVSIGESARETVDQMRAGTRAPRGTTRAPASAVGHTASAPDDADRLAWARAEAAFQAELFGQTLEELLARQSKVLDKAPGAFTADELLRSILPLRAPAADRLRACGRGDEAAAYETAPTGALMPLDMLLGKQPEAAQTDPAEPHGYVDAGGVCETCGREQDELIHQS
jgi:hypothetical protein